jgi:hypothetical protein
MGEIAFSLFCLAKSVRPDIKIGEPKGLFRIVERPLFTVIPEV